MIAMGAFRLPSGRCGGITLTEQSIGTLRPLTCDLITATPASPCAVGSYVPPAVPTGCWSDE